MRTPGAAIIASRFANASTCRSLTEPCSISGVSGSQCNHDSYIGNRSRHSLGSVKPGFTAHFLNLKCFSIPWISQ
jgi:hypothetical protein